MARDPEKTPRRAALRARRRELAAARSPEADGSALAEHVLALVAELGLGPGSVVTSYAAVPGEPPTAAVNAALAAHGIRVLLPITLPDLDLDWWEAADAGTEPTGDAATGTEPTGDAATGAAPRPLGRDAVATADLVLAPGLAVDRTGTRMGQGGGCYDRVLPRRRPGIPVVVVLHPGELVAPDEPPLPREAHDEPVDAVVTADGLVDLGLSPWRSPRA
ncbi:5-formyltetrahydrofolate cyclo-ligase [Fodinibacter luteus]|uniref:5-formyltetrahydrofolate cyclo-ligase n=1 Tax=Fodinibacter luteus TaxID=552064 RepID=A0ABP8JWM3_9MICO